MELDELFKVGKHKGKSLEDVWQGLSQDFSFLYVKELTDLILRKGNRHDKLYYSLFDLETIDKDFTIVFNNSDNINIICSQEFIIIESRDVELIESAKRVIKKILNGKFCAHNFGFFKRHFADIRHELPCEFLKIIQIAILMEDKFLIKCSQKIFGKTYEAFEIVKLDFFEQNDLWHYVKDLTMSNKKIQIDCSYPIINCQSSNIEIQKDTDNTHPLAPGIKLNPMVSEDSNEILATKEGFPIFLKTKIVLGKAYHKLDIEDYPAYEPTLSNGSKEILKMIGDPSYIEWCMINWEDFYISDDDLNYLQNDIKPHNIEFDIQEIDAKVLKYKVKFVDFEFILNDSSINENDRKYVAISEQENEDDFSNFQLYGSSSGGGSYDEFNGAYGFDDDTINDAFEGDPSNYWNID